MEIVVHYEAMFGLILIPVLAFVALLLLAFSGALVELVRGRRPALVTKSTKSR